VVGVPRLLVDGRVQGGGGNEGEEVDGAGGEVVLGVGCWVVCGAERYRWAHDGAACVWSGVLGSMGKGVLFFLLLVVVFVAWVGQVGGRGWGVHSW